MSRAILVVLGMAALGYFAPQFIEHATTPCEALVTSLLRNDPSVPRDPTAAGLVYLFSDIVGRRAAAERYPNVPPEMTCALSYWRARFSTSPSDLSIPPPRRD